MKPPVCPVCACPMIRHGKTAAGRQRYRCKPCARTDTKTYDTTTRAFVGFLAWLCGPDPQHRLRVPARTQRRHNEPFWAYWALPPIIDEVYPIIHLDGIYLGRQAVVLIAYSGDHVLGWYLARRETSRAYQALLARIAAPDLVVIDGGPGLANALNTAWPHTKVQRCAWHLFSLVTRYTTQRPRLPAGRELRELMHTLMEVRSLAAADAWVDAYSAWLTRWEVFLTEQAKHKDGYWRDKHERLVKAYKAINRVLASNELFTYLDPTLSGPVARTNSPIEGAVNAQLRAMVRTHRGLPLIRRIKAIYWWCYLHSPNPKPAPEILAIMPTDTDIAAIYQQADETTYQTALTQGWGGAIAWHELHHTTPSTTWD